MKWRYLWTMPTKPMLKRPNKLKDWQITCSKLTLPQKRKLEPGQILKIKSVFLKGKVHIHIRIFITTLQIKVVCAQGFLQTASKFAIFYVTEDACIFFIFFKFFISCNFTGLYQLLLSANISTLITYVFFFYFSQCVI